MSKTIIDILPILPKPQWERFFTPRIGQFLFDCMSGHVHKTVDLEWDNLMTRNLLINSFRPYARAALAILFQTTSPDHSYTTQQLHDYLRLSFPAVKDHSLRLHLFRAVEILGDVGLFLFCRDETETSFRFKNTMAHIFQNSAEYAAPQLTVIQKIVLRRHLEGLLPPPADSQFQQQIIAAEKNALANRTIVPYDTYELHGEGRYKRLWRLLSSQAQYGLNKGKRFANTAGSYFIYDCNVLFHHVTKKLACSFFPASEENEMRTIRVLVFPRCHSPIVYRQSQPDILFEKIMLAPLFPDHERELEYMVDLLRPLHLSKPQRKTFENGIAYLDDYPAEVRDHFVHKIIQNRLSDDYAPQPDWALTGEGIIYQ